jgi:hypothetical protein
MIDEDQRRVLGGQRFVKADLIWHTIEPTKATVLSSYADLQQIGAYRQQ